MDKLRLRHLLERVRTGALSFDEALHELNDLPFADLGYAMVDHHRALRQGAPEVIFGLGKTPEQIVGIAHEIARTGQNVLITRLDAEKARTVREALPALNYHCLARTATLEQVPIEPLGKLPIALVCAGTGDIPVAEECAETLRLLGVRIERLYDVGVAGIHRLLSRRELFERTALAIVVAGMEGALPSVVGGLVSIPVIAVPTSVGYGAAFGGMTALACMLTSCASGITVCNIDNGFGAAFAAARIFQLPSGVTSPHPQAVQQRLHSSISPRPPTTVTLLTSCQALTWCADALHALNLVHTHTRCSRRMLRDWHYSLTSV